MITTTTPPSISPYDTNTRYKSLTWPIPSIFASSLKLNQSEKFFADKVKLQHNTFHFNMFASYIENFKPLNEKLVLDISTRYSMQTDVF